jgi:DNA-binding FadR family transcriptional regulator
VTVRAPILDGRLQPGRRLHSDERCRWLGLSRTPVRDALARLEEDGLVETSPRYTHVSPLDRRATRDTAQIVATVQALAAELAVPNLTEAEFGDRAHARAPHAPAAPHGQIVDPARGGDAGGRAAAVRDSWLTLASLLDASFPDPRSLE